MFAVRFMFILLFSPVFRLLKSKITMMEIIFATVAGLRGSVSLIMAQGLITDHDASTQNLDFNAPEVRCLPHSSPGHLPCHQALCSLVPDDTAGVTTPYA